MIFPRKCVCGGTAHWHQKLERFVCYECHLSMEEKPKMQSEFGRKKIRIKRQVIPDEIGLISQTVQYGRKY